MIVSKDEVADLCYVLAIYFENTNLRDSDEPALFEKLTAINEKLLASLIGE